MEKITIEVTEKHIKKGLPGYCSECAVALAVRSLKLRNVEVDGEFVYFKTKGQKYEARLPKKAEKFITKFDNSFIDRTKLKPFSFAITPTLIPAVA